MKKITLVIALFFSILAVQAQTKTTPTPSDDKNQDEQESLANDYLSQIMGVALSATSNMKLFHFVYDWIGTPYRLSEVQEKASIVLLLPKNYTARYSTWTLNAAHAIFSAWLARYGKMN